ncbi:hypothetical protein ABZ860_13045 [Microbispora sp. NPDC046973]|uniref:hypothetical protein n=1 Tax=Microbispora sp. NPDC046973 TaxID=3155022 RepID=UPI0033E22246
MRRVLAGEPAVGGQADPVGVETVDRRGRPVRLAVTLAPLHEDGASVQGLILVMSGK